MTHEVRLGMIGSGFIADHYVSGLRYVPGARVVANASTGGERGRAFAARHAVERTYDSIAALCADPDVDLVVISLPNHLHPDAVRAATAAGKGVLCTKPLGRNADEAAEMLRLVTDAGVFHGYLENEVFAPEVMKIIGKDISVADVFAWGATLGHADKMTGEDNAIAILRFEDGRTATIEVSRTAKGGIEVRNEIYCERGRIIYDLGSTPIRAFLEQSVGYLAEKTDADTGWVYPVADEPRVAGYDEQFRHFVQAFRDDVEPRETFHDGFIVNTIIDAAYRSMRGGRREAVRQDVPERVA